MHCIVDAILGALTLPDIGQLFPDNDPKWKGAASSVFVKEAVSRSRTRRESLSVSHLLHVCRILRILMVVRPSSLFHLPIRPSEVSCVSGSLEWAVPSS
jgi:hypothetical protein